MAGGAGRVCTVCELSAGSALFLVPDCMGPCVLGNGTGVSALQAGSGVYTLIVPGPRPWGCCASPAGCSCPRSTKAGGPGSLRSGSARGHVT